MFSILGEFGSFWFGSFRFGLPRARSKTVNPSDRRGRTVLSFCCRNSVDASLSHTSRHFLFIFVSECSHLEIDRRSRRISGTGGPAGGDLRRPGRFHLPPDLPAVVDERRPEAHLHGDGRGPSGIFRGPARRFPVRAGGLLPVRRRVLRAPHREHLLRGDLPHGLPEPVGPSHQAHLEPDVRLKPENHGMQSGPRLAGCLHRVVRGLHSLYLRDLPLEEHGDVRKAEPARQFSGRLPWMVGMLLHRDHFSVGPTQR